MNYSALKVFFEGLSGNKGWKPMWREPEPQNEYDIIIVGGGGHGLATAYYLAKEFGVRKVAVLEKGWIGSGNIGRNTTIIRSNYLLKGNQPFYELSMKLWENLEQEFNYNAMVSQRGIMNLFHNDPQRDAYVRRGNAMMVSGAGAIMLDEAELRATAPYLDFDNANVLIYLLEDGSKIAIRPSGTEPKIKFYFSTNQKIGKHQSWKEVEKQLESKIDILKKAMGV